MFLQRAHAAVGRIAGMQKHLSLAFFFEDQHVLFARNRRVIESRQEMTGRRTEITVTGSRTGSRGEAHHGRTGG
jgi:hypothetical protein